MSFTNEKMCMCGCHKIGSCMLHCFPCCDLSYVKYIDKDGNYMKPILNFENKIVISGMCHSGKTKKIIEEYLEEYSIVFLLEETKEKFLMLKEKFNKNKNIDTIIFVESSFDTFQLDLNNLINKMTRDKNIDCSKYNTLIIDGNSLTDKMIYLLNQNEYDFKKLIYTQSISRESANEN